VGNNSEFGGSGTGDIAINEDGKRRFTFYYHLLSAEHQHFWVGDVRSLKNAWEGAEKFDTPCLFDDADIEEAVVNAGFGGDASVLMVRTP